MDFHRPLSRRDFLKRGGAALLLFGILGPLGAYEWDKQHPVLASVTDPVLVVLQLSGGNDGLNTVIPYGIGTYYDNRPTLAYAQKDVLPLNNQLGLHPSLSGMKKLYDNKKLAIINGVGYPNPNRSHFRSMDIWQTAAPDKTDVYTGWLGRYLDATNDPKRNPLAGLTVGSGGKAMLARTNDAPQIDSVALFKLLYRRESFGDRAHREEAFRQMYAASQDATLRLAAAKGSTALNASDKVQTVMKNENPSQGYPDNSKLATDLQLIAELTGANIGTNVYFTQLGGFDDHAQEKNDHARVLQDLDKSVSAFYADLEKRGLADRVTVLMYSEFGRRVKENASHGTDHGTAAPVFVLGGRVKGGLYGEMPSLTSLDNNGDLKYTVDFRSVYATLLDRWLAAPSKDILGGSFSSLPIF